VGSGAEAEHVELVKSGEEGGWFYRVTVDSGRRPYRRRQSAPVFTQLSREATRLTTRHKEDRAAKLLGQRQQFKVAAFTPSQAVKARWAGPQITSVLPT
jgi:hypothetical protein